MCPQVIKFINTCYLAPHKFMERAILQYRSCFKEKFISKLIVYHCLQNKLKIKAYQVLKIILIYFYIHVLQLKKKLARLASLKYPDIPGLVLIYVI